MSDVTQTQTQTAAGDPVEIGIRLAETHGLTPEQVRLAVAQARADIAGFHAAAAPPAANPHAGLSGFSFAALLEAETRTADVDLGLVEPVVLHFYPRKLTPELIDRINAQDTAKKNAMAEKGASAVLDAAGMTKYGIIDGLSEVVFDWNVPDMPFGVDALRRLGFPVLLAMWQAVNEAAMGNDDESETETSF